MTLRFAIQLHDDEPSCPSFLIDAAADQNPNQLPLIPDFYCLGSQGYAALRQRFAELPDWHRRLPIAIWRGASTGAGELRLDTFNSLQRYQLCRHSLEDPGWLDARFSAVVQTATVEANQVIRQHLVELDLLRPRMEPEHMGLHRWLIDIDGNVNSWGLLWKLLSGSCILRVESKRQQWFYRHLKTWHTHVPIAADLNDLPEKLAWCRQHQTDCSAIAQTGQQVAEQVVNDLQNEMERAVEIYSERWL
ncbi:glycosyl transferase family 90 [Synechococcus sp. PROS-U-1]|uniref:glycosyl transferase family 90 n=1 Tax=Synechococcus sp. PROS-U-1 TaxID=1400866 RepID=UPI0016494D65|nr:glycosyl transferase family 90 [Synechococcus sp. PROS-U-1]